MTRQWKIALVAGIAVGLLIGCRPGILPSPSVRAPRLPGDHAELQQAVQPFLPEGARLAIPVRPQTNAAIWTADLNGDGVIDGALAFYRKPDSNMELGVLVLAKSGDQWTLRDHLKEVGREFDYALLKDLNGDRIPELLIGCSGSTSTSTLTGMSKDLTIYAAQQGKFVSVARYPYLEIATGNLNSEQKVSISLMKPDESRNSLTLISVYEYTGENVQEQAHFEMDGYPSSLVIGKATPERQGLFVELGMGAHSAKTLLVVQGNGSWTRIFDSLKAPTFKSYPLPSTDVNNDGIIEIGKQVAPPGTGKMAMAQIPWYEEWFQWDGNEGLKRVSLTYSDYLNRYRFTLPAAWKETVTADRRDDSGIGTVQFYYLGANEARLAPLLTIRAVPKTTWPVEEQQYKGMGQRYLTLADNGDKLIVALLYSVPTNLTSGQQIEYRQLVLNETNLKGSFTTLPH